jgi:hypothetical protein
MAAAEPFQGAAGGAVARKIMLPFAIAPALLLGCVQEPVAAYAAEQIEVLEREIGHGGAPVAVGIQR